MDINNLMNYFEYNSCVTLSMFFISFIVLVLDKLLRGKLTKRLFSTGRGSLLNPSTYIGLFTHILGHENWEHFSSNYMKILLLGPLIEEKYGLYNYLCMILITAFITAIYNIIKGNKRIYGASGIAFMLTVLSAFVNIRNGKIPLTLVLIIIFYIIDELKGLFRKDNIAHDAHIVGALCGIVFGFIFINYNITDLFSDFCKLFVR